MTRDSYEPSFDSLADLPEKKLDCSAIRNIVANCNMGIIKILITFILIYVG